ncbi:MAG: dicarboxylate/amino acid:cation symporter [Bacteroidales bacterium]|nr:dicarboxylate/amino acid:cation symporter [Bacteroidales bacterium]
MKKIPLTWQMAVAAVAAMLCWYVFPVAAEYAGELTDLYIRLLSLILMPYVFLNMMHVFTKENTEGVFGRIALKNLTWFVVVQTFAVAVSVFLSDIIFQNFEVKPDNTGVYKGFNQQKNFGDFIFTAVPENFYDAVISNNLLTIVLITCILGYLASKCKDRTRTYLLSFFSSFSDLIQKCAELTLNLAPIGVFCFMSRLLVQGGVFDFNANLTPFIIAVSVSLMLYAFVTLPLIVKITAKTGAFRFLKIFSSTLLISAISRNSILGMPVTANKMSKEAGVTNLGIPFFSLPLTTVLSFCGTSIYLCVAALYTAQAYGINMSFSEGIILVLSCVFISVASFETPLKLTVLLFPVLERLGIPIEGIGVLTVCDLFFSFVCSGVDSWSNLCANIVIAASEGGLSPQPSAKP